MADNVRWDADFIAGKREKIAATLQDECEIRLYDTEQSGFGTVTRKETFTVLDTVLCRSKQMSFAREHEYAGQLKGRAGYEIIMLDVRSDGVTRLDVPLSAVLVITRATDGYTYAVEVIGKGGEGATLQFQLKLYGAQENIA